MQIIPLAAVPTQTVSVVLAGQSCQINLRTRTTGLFLDLYVGGTLLIGGVLCLNANRIVRSAYLGFTGDLSFFDMQGDEDPTYDGVGTRFLLMYVEAADLEAAGVT